MTTTAPDIVHPEVASREEWLAARKQHLLHEKELTRHHDRISAERRRLPMVKIEKDYRFIGPDGVVGLAELFDGKVQLIVHHFMFDPEWEAGCRGCTGHVNAFGDLSYLQKRNTNYVIVSRAPIEKLEAYKASKGWKWPWYSSFGSDFNYDFHVTLDEEVMPIEYNYTSKEEWAEKGHPDFSGEVHGMSVFFRIGSDLYHTYSSYARGVENLTDASAFLDITPYGRQEDWEDSPAGWPQNPTYG